MTLRDEEANYWDAIILGYRAINVLDIDHQELVPVSDQMFAEMKRWGING